MYFEIILTVLITVMTALGIWEIVDRIRLSIKDMKEKAYNKGFADACNEELPF